MYDDLLGPRKEKEKKGMERKINLKRKYKLDADTSPETMKDEEDPWAGAGEDLVNEEEETILDLTDFEDDGLDEEIEKALKDFVDEDDCDCDEDDELYPSQDIGN